MRFPIIEYMFFVTAGHVHVKYATFLSFCYSVLDTINSIHVRGDSVSKNACSVLIWMVHHLLQSSRQRNRFLVEHTQSDVTNKRFTLHGLRTIHLLQKAYTTFFKRLFLHILLTHFHQQYDTLVYLLLPEWLLKATSILITKL